MSGEGELAMSMIAGPYKWRFGANSLGIVANAPEVEWVNHSQPITADAWGGQEIDGINLGKTGILEMVFQEYDALGVVDVLQSFSGTTGQPGGMGNLGCTFAELEADVLWGQAIDPANNCASPDQFVAYRAIVAPDTPIRHTLGWTLKQIPIRFTLYPYRRNNNFYIYETGNAIWNAGPPITGAPLKSDAQGIAAYLNSIA
jgi:hypothetical protein